MARSRQNPNGGSMLLLAGAAAAAYYAYTQGWFTTQTVVPAGTGNQPATNTGNPINNGAAVVNTPTPAPPLGTVAKNGNEVAAQLVAKYPYIIPDPNNASSLGAALASAGYVNYQINIAADGSNSNPSLQTIYLRPDVATPEQALNATRAARAGSTVYDTLDDIKRTMQANGLSGLSAFGSGF